jgi:hypothetical protein
MQLELGSSTAFMGSGVRQFSVLLLKFLSLATGTGWVCRMAVYYRRQFLGLIQLPQAEPAQLELLHMPTYSFWWLCSPSTPRDAGDKGKMPAADWYQATDGSAGCF